MSKLRRDLRDEFFCLSAAITEDERAAARVNIERLKSSIMQLQSSTEATLVEIGHTHDRLIKEAGKDVHDVAAWAQRHGFEEPKIPSKSSSSKVRIARNAQAKTDLAFPDPPVRKIEVTQELLSEIATAIRVTVGPMLGKWKYVKGEVARVAHKTQINRAALGQIIGLYTVNLAEMLGAGSVSVWRHLVYVNR